MGRTTLPPDAVLSLAKRLELEAGRKHGPRDAPRPLDVDLLLYGDGTCDGDTACDRPELTLPHPRLRQRRFALVPLAELAPGWPLPPDGVPVARALEELEATRNPRESVEPVPWSRPPRTRSQEIQHPVRGPEAAG